MYVYNIYKMYLVNHIYIQYVYIYISKITRFVYRRAQKQPDPKHQKYMFQPGSFNHQNNENPLLTQIKIKLHFIFLGS